MASCGSGGKWFRGIFLMAGILAMLAVGGRAEEKTAAAAPVDPAKPGIVLVAFGTSIPEAQKVFDVLLKSAQEKFPGYDIVYGFTARSIVKTLREEKRDHGVLTLEEALAEMKKRGHAQVVLQSLHVSPGQKDAEMRKADALGMKVAYGAPLLATEAELEKVVAALKDEVVKDAPNVFCGHGNDKHPEYNAMMIAFDKAVRKLYPGSVLCTVEGEPGSGALNSEVKPAVAKAGGKIHFIPMMIVAGDHILNDVSGEEAESWKNIVGAKEVTIAKPLGYNPAVQAIFWAHLQQALGELADKK